jgi:hypothetical protein
VAICSSIIFFTNNNSNNRHYNMTINANKVGRLFVIVKPQVILLICVSAAFTLLSNVIIDIKLSVILF